MFNISDRASLFCRMVRTPIIVILVLIAFTSGPVLALSVGRTALPLAVYVNGECYEYTTVTDNVDSIITAHKIPTDKNDASKLYKLSNGMVLMVGAAFEIKVVKDGKTYKTNLPCCSVEAVLESLGINLDDNYATSLPLDAILTKDTEIIVTRISHKIETVYEEIEFDTIYEDTDSLPAGKVVTVTDGKTGTIEITYDIVEGDGKEISRTIVSETVISEPTERKCLRGTGKGSVSSSSSGITNNSRVNSKLVSPFSYSSQIEVDENGRPLHYKNCISGVATAYCPESSGTICSTGVRAQVGYIAVNPKQIPYGTRLYIRTSDGSYIYGVAEAADTGGFISSSTVKVDLYFGSYSEAVNFGRRSIEIYYL